MSNLSMLRKIKIINLFFFLWLMVVFSLYPFVELDKESRMAFSNNNGVRYCIKQRFEEKVAAYIDELQNDLSQNYSTVATLNEVLLQVQNCTKLEQMIALLNRVVDNSFIREHKRVQCALLLRASVVLGDYVCEMLLDLLAIVGGHLSYWQKMNDHSSYYFFHKSPFKWTTRKNQQQEINDNIQLLYAIKKKYLETLGALTKHVQQFNENATIDEHYAWLGQYIMILQTLYMRRHMADTIDCGHAMSAMRQVLKNILPYKNHALLIVGKAKPPHHFVRNWMRYAIVLIGTGFAYKNRVLIDTWIGKEAQSQYKKSLCRAWREYFINPMKGAYDTIMISKEPKKLNIAGGIQEQEELIAQDKMLLAEQENQVQKYIEDTEERRIIACESIEEDLRQKCEAGQITIEEKEEILCDIQKDDVGSYQQFVNDLPKLSNIRWSDTSWFESTIEVAAAQSIWNLLQFILFSDAQKVVNDTRSIVGHALKTLTNVDEALVVSRKTLLYCVDLLDSELKKNQMTLRFTALIPAMVTGWSMYKLTSKFYLWLTRCNYSVIRNIVFQIYAMLVEFHGDMNNECYGKLIFLLYKLKYAVLAQISQKSIKREFLRDIEMLSWHHYTTEEKRLLINNMRWKYDFLSPVYNT